MDEIHYLLGNSCNLKCKFCFWDLRVHDISLARKKIIIDEIKKSGIRKITISGGEPLCNKDVLPILGYAKQSGLEVVLHTNGLLIDRDLACQLKLLVSRISLSFDGSSDEIMYKMRHNHQMFSHTISLIKTLCSLNIPVNVKTIVTRENQDDILNIGKIVSNYPIEYWSLLEFNPINRGLINKDIFYLPSNEFDLIAGKARQRFSDLIIKVRKFVRDPGKYCFIAPNGDVYKYVDRKGDEVVGNLFKIELKQILCLI